MAEQSEADSSAAIKVAKQVAAGVLKRSTFSYRGFSKRTTDSLVAYAIDAPERLLFMSLPQIQTIPGLGKSALAEIVAYRERFLIK
jgi:hypothetical protein